MCTSSSLLVVLISLDRQPFTFAHPVQLPFNTPQSPVPEHPGSHTQTSSDFYDPDLSSQLHTNGLPHLGRQRQLPFYTPPFQVPQHPTGPTPSSLQASYSNSSSQLHSGGLSHLGQQFSVMSTSSNPSQSSVQSARISRRQSADRMNARTASGQPRTRRTGRAPRPFPGFGAADVSVDTVFSSGSGLDPDTDDRTCCVMVIPHQVRLAYSRNATRYETHTYIPGPVYQRTQPAKWLYLRA
jgi:hypothetical protein